MADNDLDQKTIAEYRRAIEAAAVNNPAVKGATAAVLAALDRRDWQWRELLALAGAVAASDMTELPHAREASCVFGCPGMLGRNNEYIHVPDCPVTRARALLAR